MSLYIGDNRVSGAALIDATRTVLPDCTAKRLSRLMGLSLRTAKHWLYYGPATAKRVELATRLLAEMERQDRIERDQVRRRLFRVIEDRE